jgi:hypothetical protein
MVANANWTLNEAWNGIDENYKLGYVISNSGFSWPSHVPTSKRLYSYYADHSWSSFWILAGWELKRALAEMYGTALVPLMTSDILSKKWLSEQIRKLNEDDVIASMNYDLLAEHIARQRWPQLQNCRTHEEFCNRASIHGPLILKLHGSLDWAFRSNRNTRRNRVDRVPDCSPIQDDDIDLDQNFWEARPLVVSPVRYKDEVVFPNAQPTELVEVLSFQWKSFIDALSRADELRVFGYSFPTEDSYGNRMVQEAVRRRQASSILPIRLYLPDEESQKVKNMLETDVFPRGSVKVQCCGKIPS